VGLVGTNQLLRMEGIYKSFSGTQVLNNVHFDLKEGEVHCLLGENGAGKSTLIKILSGAYTADEGKIYINGNLISIKNPRDSLNLGITTIYQETSLIPGLTVAENIFFGEEITKVSVLNKSAMENKATNILQDMNADINPKRLAGELSIAQQQMVEIARSLREKRRIIIMDEPTSSLSEKDSTELFRIIRNLKSQGVSFIYISHRLQEFEKIVDRITILRDGNYIDTVNMEDVIMDQLINKMVGREYVKQERVENRSVNEIILKVEGIKYKNVVKNAGFELKKGEILGFAGMVGSGRSELMKIIFGANRFDSGNMVLKGKQVRFRSPSDAVKNGIVYLSEDRKHEGLILNASVEHNISLTNLSRISKMFFIDFKKERLQANEQIKSLRIVTSSEKKKIKFLSGGNQQKVVIAKWLLTHSDILIFDEPTRGIDVGARAEIYQLIEDLVKQGKSIIIVSSDLPEILRLSNRIAVMNQGRIVANIENSEDLTQEQIMSHMVVGNFAE
jgi:ribose transport system ATP-binding protein